MSELKPCPFCGADAEEFTERDERVEPLVASSPMSFDVFVDNTYYGVGCPKCDVRQTNCYIEREYAAKAWNTRTLEPQSSDDVELFRGLAKFLYEQMTPGQLLKIGRYIGGDELKALYEVRSRSEQDIEE